MRTRKIVLAMLLCASGSITGATKPTADLSTFKTVAVTVKGADDIKNEEKKELKDDIVKLLQEEVVWIPAEKGDLSINVSVTEMSRVSTAARLLVGAFA